MLLGLLLGLLHLLALLLLMRLTLPERTLLLNPYAAYSIQLSDKMIGFLRTALPLPSKALGVLLLLLIFSLRAAALTKVPDGAVFQMGMLSICRLPAVSYLDWLGVEVLHFAYFYLGLATAYAWLRLWHLLRPFSGYTGDLIRCVGRPLTLLPLPILWPVLIVSYLVLTVLLHGLGEVSQPLLQIPEVTAAFQQLGTLNPLDFTSYTIPAQVVLQTCGSVIGILLDMQNMLFLLILMSLISALFGSPAMRYFLGDAIHLLIGPIPPLRLGPLDFSPIVAFFLYGLIAPVLMTLVVLIVWLFN